MFKFKISFKIALILACVVFFVSLCCLASVPMPYNFIIYIAGVLGMVAIGKKMETL